MTYLSSCGNNDNDAAVYDAVSGQLITTCNAIAAQGPPVGVCTGTNCSYIPVVYVSCGACPAGGVLPQLNCAGPYTAGRWEQSISLQPTGCATNF